MSRVAPAPRPTTRIADEPGDGPDEPDRDSLTADATTLRETGSGPDPAGLFTRVRLVDADFKYPLIRVEETFTRDATTGAEHVVRRSEMVADHIVVRLRRDVSESDLLALNRSYGARVLSALPLPGAYLVQFAAQDPDAVLRAIQAYSAEAKLVAYAEPDYIVHAEDVFPNDPSFSQLYALHNTGQSGGTPDADIDAPEAWAVTTGSAAVVVGVIDTGVDYTHPDLASNIWVNPGEIPGDGIDNDHNSYTDDVHGVDFYNNDGDPMDDNSHGTHVSGTIAAIGDNGIGVVGVNWRARIMALKFLGSGGSGTSSDAARALLYAAAMKNGAGVNVRLTSNSWGGGGASQLLQDAITANQDENILFVCAAGNNASDNDDFPFYPASYTNESVIAVASTDNKDQRSSFSNYGFTNVDLGAPGSSILSTIPGGGYGTKSGTSMATPHVAGVIALMLAVAPDANWSDLKEDLLVGVDLIPALAGKVRSGGRLNALNAILSLGMRVRSTIPASGDVLAVPPAEVFVEFTYPYDPSTIDAGDCLLNGVPADGFMLPDATTVEFSYTASPVTNEGLQDLVVPDGAVARDGSAQSNREYHAQFRYDVLPLSVVSTEPATGAVASLPLTTITLHLNEPVDTNSVNSLDLAVSQGYVMSASAIDPQTVQYDLGGVTNEGTLAIKLQQGALRDAHGNPSLSYEFSVDLDISSASFPVPLAGVAPAGSRIYQGAQSAFITSSDTDDFAIVLEAGQLITAVVDPSSSLRPTVALLDPALQPLDSAEAPEVGTPALLQGVAIPADGTCTLRVAGLDGTTGSYTLRLYLNALLEEEDEQSTSNDTPDDAQSLDGAFVSVGGPTQTRAAVLGAIRSTEMQTVQTESFETGSLGTNWTTYSSLAGGEIAVTNNAPAADGSQYLLLDKSGVDTNFNLNEAVWHVDLSGLNAAQLRFRHAQWNEELNLWSNVRFTGHRNDDGISISDRGGAWHQIWVPQVRQAAGTWITYTADLSDNAAEARMRFGPDFRIKFQQYDNQAWPDDGMGFDRLEILAPVPTEDWYVVNLAAGERLGVRLTPRGLAWLHVELYDGSNNLLRAGAPIGPSREEAVDEFTVLQTGTYRLRVTGGGDVEYALVVTRNAVFDAEPNNGSANAQDVTATGRAFGQLGNEGVLYAYEAPSIYLGSILRLDPQTLAVMDGFTAPYHTGAWYFADAGELAYDSTSLWFVAGKDTGGVQRVFKVDPASGDTEASFEVNTPTDVTGVGALGGEIFLGTRQNTIDVYDDASFTLKRSLPDNLPGWLTGLEGDARLGTVFGTAKADTLYKLDPQSGVVLDKKSMNPRPDGVEISLGLAGDEAFIGNWLGEKQVLVLNPDTLDLVRQMDWSGSPLGGLAGEDSGGPRDEYIVSALEGDALSIQTATPGKGPAASAVGTNALDPALDLLDPAGDVIASDDNSAGDGVNALVEYEVPTPGLYRVRVRSMNGTGGDYGLTVSGAHGPPVHTELAMTVPPDMTLTRGEETGSVAGVATAISDCGSTVTVTYTDTILAGSCDGSAVIQREWTASDECGNTTSQVQIITAEDTTPPMLNVPSGTNVAWGTDLAPASVGEATAEDDWGSVVSTNYEDDIAAGPQAHQLTLTRTWSAEDGCGNVGFGVQVVSITNALPPVMEDEPAYTLGSDNTVAWTNPVVADLYRAEYATNGDFSDAIGSDWSDQRDATFTGLGEGLYYFRAKASLTSDVGTLETEWSEPVSSLQLNPEGDRDGDGVNNRDEDTAGTSPTDSESRFELLGVQNIDDVHVEVLWRGGSNVLQVLESSMDPLTDDWIPVYTNLPPMDPTNSLLLPDPAGTGLIFRLRAIR